MGGTSVGGTSVGGISVGGTRVGGTRVKVEVTIVLVGVDVFVEVGTSVAVRVKDGTKVVRFSKGMMITG